MAPASLQLTLFEPVVFLRGLSAVGEDARGRRRPINFDAPPSQLRGLITLQLPKPSKIKEITILLQGKARTDWPEGIGPTRIDTSEDSIIFSQKIVLFSAKDAQPGPNNRRRANSVGTLIEESTASDSRQNNTRSYSQASVPSTSPPSFRGRDGDRSPTLARSIGHAAARAGTAMLPPTLVREINASKQASFISRSASSSPMRSPNSFRSSSSSSSRPTSSSYQRLDCYFDPPPLYVHDRPAVSASSSSQSLIAPDQTTYSNSEDSADWASNHVVDNMNLSITSQKHPQSIRAAGPSNRSILHPSGRQEAKQPSNSAVSGAGVRFDPQAISANLEYQQQQEALHHVNLEPVTSGSHSEPSSTRTSGELGRSIGLSFKDKGKGKGKSTSPAVSPGAGAKKAIKGLLGNLLKEDDEARSSSNNGHVNSTSSVDEDGVDDREFRKGTYTFPFSIPLPANLPPTLHADFGSNTYMVRAHVHRSGPLTSNLNSDKEITLVHAPDEDGQDENDAIVVERNWEDCLRYIVVVSGKSFPVGSKIPVWIKFVPTEKVRIHRIVASLEERTAYFAKGRRVARHEVPRRWNLLKLAPAENTKEGLLPILSDSADAISSNPLAPYARAAVDCYTVASNIEAGDLMASLLDPFGPWELAMDLEVPIRGSPIINISTNHTKSNIAVSHLVKLAIRVERVQNDGGERKLFDILIEAPVTINHSHTANAWLSLPTYLSVGQDDQALPTRDTRQQQAAQRTTTTTSSSSSDTPSTSSIRRQTAPSLTPNRRLGGSVRVEAVSRPSTSPAPPPLQGRINSNLVELSQQWLSLSANADLATTNSSVVPMTAQQQNEESGLPTYAMIDNARGSVDLPSRGGGTSVK